MGGRETRRHAFRRQLWELRRNTPVSNRTGRSCVVSTNGPRRVRDRVRPPMGRRGGKGTVEGAGRGTPPGTAAAFCGGATVTAKPLSPHPLRSWSWLRGAPLFMYARTRVCCMSHTRSIPWPWSPSTLVWVCVCERICVCTEERSRWNPPSLYPIPRPIRSPFVLLLVRGLSRPSKSISTPAPTSSSRIILKCFSDSHFGDSQVSQLPFPQ